MCLSWADFRPMSSSSSTSENMSTSSLECSSGMTKNLNGFLPDGNISLLMASLKRHLSTLSLLQTVVSVTPLAIWSFSNFLSHLESMSSRHTLGWKLLMILTASL